jgi:chromosome segregation ATPase
VEHDEGNPIADAEAQLYRRIQELRDRARAERRASVPSAPAEHGPGTPDLRTILSRAESHVGELRQTAESLQKTLPEAVERAIEKAMDDHSTPRRLGELRDLVRALSAQIEQVNRDLLAERLGRVEDLELLVDLLSTGMAALRQDVADLAGSVGKVGAGVDRANAKLDQPVQVTVERAQQAGVRDLFRPTEAEPTPAGSRPEAG